jgi:hypothetical protein
MITTKHGESANGGKYFTDFESADRKTLIHLFYHYLSMVFYDGFVAALFQSVIGRKISNVYYFRIFFLIAFIAINGSISLAQKHDYNWLMGYDGIIPPHPNFGNMRVDFHHDPPKVFSDEYFINFRSCAATVSDSLGGLLFFTNGIHIYDRFGQIMEGGDTINPGEVWELAEEYGYVDVWPVFALPKPGASNIYYLIHNGVEIVGTTGYAKYLYYSIIDMNLNEGLGKVLIKNQILMEGDIVCRDAVKHGNGRDWWIIGLQAGDTNHYLFRLSANGISGPYIQDFGPPISLPEYAVPGGFSRDGNLFIRQDIDTEMRIYDFDRCSGLFSNLRIIPYVPGDFYAFNAVFSPDNHFIYLNNPYWIWTIDMQAEDLSASYDTLTHWEWNFNPHYPFGSGYWGGVVAPDNKIYYSNYAGTSRSMNIIHRPNFPADAADCEEEALHLPHNNRFTFNFYPNYRLGEWDESPCDTFNLQGPDDGFEVTRYAAPPTLRDTTYKVFSPIRGIACPDCTPRDFEMLRSPMQYMMALETLRLTGKPPADWPTEKAERIGLFLTLPPKPNK